MKVTREMVAQGAVQEVGGFWLAGEASSMGLPPGQWPRQIETDLGNGQMFCRTHLSEAGAEYAQALGILKLRIWND